MSEHEYSELKTLKLVLFEFYKSINQYRNVGKYSAMFLIMTSFFQIYYLLDALIVCGNLTSEGSGYSFYTSLNIYDFVRIAIKFSLLIPILEYEKDIFTGFYPIIVIFIYIVTLSLIASWIYVLRCIIQDKEIYFKFCLSFNSATLLLFEWILYLPILYTLFYPVCGKITEGLAPFNSLGLIIFNIILGILYFALGFVNSVLNNDALNRYDNSLCRKDANIEIYLNYLRFILMITFILKLNQALNNVIALAVSIIVLILLVMKYQNKHFYEEFIAKIFGSMLVCYFKILLDGFIALIWNTFLHDYSIAMIVCFIMNFFIFDFLHRRMRTLFLKKSISELQDIDEMILYIEILEDEANKAVIGDIVSGSMIAGYILEHRNTCNHVGCPLKAKGELFLPLINKSTEITSNENKNLLYKDEILLIHLLKEVFNVLREKFYGKPKYHFAFASFLLYRFGNIKLALLEIENNRKFAKNIQQQYSFHILKHIANERLLNNQYYIMNYAKSNISILDILDVMLLDQLSKDLESAIFECAKLKLDFWVILTSKKIIIEDLYKKGKDYVEKKLVVERLWKKLSLITDQNKWIITIYNMYILDICDNNNAQITTENKQKIEDDDENEDLVKMRFFDDICLFIVNTGLGPNLGLINYYNHVVSELFEFTQDELLGKNISVIQPDSIGRVHNQMLENFLQTGKTKLIGAQSKVFVKGKQRLVKPVNILVMPIPSFNDLSEVMAILRQCTTTNFYVLFNEYGIVDSYSENFKLLEQCFSLEHFELNYCDLDFFIFYIFPFLLRPVEHAGNKPLFLLEKSIMEISHTQVNAYIDPDLFSILSELEAKNNSGGRNKKRHSTSTAFYLKNRRDLENLNEDEKRKFSVYGDFKRTLVKIKEYLSGYLESDHMTNEDQVEKNTTMNYPKRKSKKNQIFNFSEDVDYIDSLIVYKSFLDDSYEREKAPRSQLIPENKETVLSSITIKQFNCNISILKFNKTDKMYIMELSLPPSDTENEERADPYEKTKSLHSQDLFGFNNKEKKSKMTNIDGNVYDDTSSVSGGAKMSQTSIQTLIQKIRDEKNLGDTFHKSSYMNWILYIFLLILLGFVVFYILHITSYTYQQMLIFSGIKYYNYLKESTLNARKLAHLEKVRYDLGDNNNNNNNKVLPNLNIYNINDTLATTASDLLILSKNITDSLLTISEKKYVDDIISQVYPLSENGRLAMMADIEDRITKNTIYITDPHSLTSPTIANKLYTYLAINITLSTFHEPEQTERKEQIDYIIHHTNHFFQEQIDKKINLLENLFFEQKKQTMNILTYCYTALSCFAFASMLLVFLTLRERYNNNQKIIEKLTTIKREDIDEIIKKVEEFLFTLKDKNPTVDANIQHEDKFGSLYQSLNDFNSSADFQNWDKMEYESLTGGKKKVNSESKRIFRKENIFFSFSLNILLILLIILSYFVTIYVLSSSFNSQYERVFNFTQNIYSSKFNNLLALDNIRDVFLSNGQVLYDNTSDPLNYSSTVFESSKAASMQIFSTYAQNLSYYPYSVTSEFDTLFYLDLCHLNNSDGHPLTIPNFSCTYTNYHFDFTKVFPKGLKYALDYYSNQIEDLILKYKDSKFNGNHNLLDVFITSNENFVIPTILIDQLLKALYDYLILSLNSQMISISNLFFILIIIISGICLFLLFLSICTKWMKYVNQIKMEEFMSIKLIAEIPINIIMRNEQILAYLKNYSSKNT